MAENVRDEQSSLSVRPANQPEYRDGWHGTLPDPEILRHYEELVPGAAERILQLAEREQTQRVEFERVVYDFERRSLLLGRLAAVALQVASIALAVVVFLYADSPSSLIFSVAILVFPALPSLIMAMISRGAEKREK